MDNVTSLDPPEARVKRARKARFDLAGQLGAAHTEDERRLDYLMQRQEYLACLELFARATGGDEDAVRLCVKLVITGSSLNTMYKGLHPATVPTESGKYPARKMPTDATDKDAGRVIGQIMRR